MLKGANAMIKSKRSRRKDKPDKPYPDFPLFPHATKRWAKKIRGKMCYFGPWADPDAALQRYLNEKDELYAGRVPREKAEGFTLRDLCNRFLTSKRHLLDTSELSQRTWDDYHQVCERLLDGFGRNRLVEDLRPDDFEQLRARLAKGIGPVTLANLIQRIRIVFKYAVDNDLVPRAIRFGQGFKRPSKKALRKARNAKGPRMFEADELRALLAAASQPLRAMIYL